MTNTYTNQKPKTKPYKSQVQLGYKKILLNKKRTQKISTERKISFHFFQKNKTDSTKDNDENLRKVRIRKSQSVHCEMLLKKLKNTKEDKNNKLKNQTEQIFKSSKSVRNTMQKSLKKLHSERKMSFINVRNDSLNLNISLNKLHEYESVEYPAQNNQNGRHPVSSKPQPMCFGKQLHFKQDIQANKQNIIWIDHKKRNQRFSAFLGQINRKKMGDNNQAKGRKYISPCKFVVNPFAKIKTRNTRFINRNPSDKLEHHFGQHFQASDFSICFKKDFIQQISQIKENACPSKNKIEIQSFQFLEILNF